MRRRLHRPSLRTNHCSFLRRSIGFALSSTQRTGSQQLLKPARGQKMPLFLTSAQIQDGVRPTINLSNVPRQSNRRGRRFTCRRLCRTHARARERGQSSPAEQTSVPRTLQKRQTKRQQLTTEPTLAGSGWIQLRHAVKCVLQSAIITDQRLAAPVQRSSAVRCAHLKCYSYGNAKLYKRVIHCLRVGVHHSFALLSVMMNCIQ